MDIVYNVILLFTCKAVLRVNVLAKYKHCSPSISSYGVLIISIWVMNIAYFENLLCFFHGAEYSGGGYVKVEERGYNRWMVEFIFACKF